MNVLVTGGAGFIGSHLVDRLLRDGHSVTVLDHFSHGSDKHFVHGQKDKHLRLINGDVGNKNDVRSEYFQGIDWVFHLAGRSLIPESLEDPRIYHRVNVSGTVYALEASRRTAVKRFLYAASASCYGGYQKAAVSESSAIVLDNPYALTKYMGEQYTLHWSTVYRLPVVIVRLFSVYGTKARPGRGFGPIISTFIRQKKDHKSYTISGDGTKYRDFIFVDDVVDAMMLAIQLPVSGECFNIGSGRAVSLNEVVALLGGPVVHHWDDPPERTGVIANFDKFYNACGWKPTVSIEEGIRRIINQERL